MPSRPYSLPAHPIPSYTIGASALTTPYPIAFASPRPRAALQ